MSANRTGLEGRLSEVPFADVLRLLQSSGQTGTLHIDDDAETVVVVAPAHVLLASRGGEPSLRNTVLGAGLVDAAGWERSIAALDADPAPGRGIELLVEAGADSERLRFRIYEYTVNTLFELLLPSDSYFRFCSGETHPFATEPGFPFDEVLDDVKRRVSEWKEIAAAIPSTSVVLRRAARLPITSGPVTLNPEEFELLGLLDGRRDVAQIVQLLGVSAFRVMTSLHHLMKLGAVEVLGGQEPARP